MSEVDTLTTKVLSKKRPQSWVHLVQHHSHIKHSRQEQHQSLVQAHKQRAASKSGFDFASLFNLDMKEPVGRFNSGFSGGFDFMDGLNFLDSKDIGYSLPSDAMPTFGRQRPQPKQDYQEQQRVRRVTEQRNQARREINSKTTEIRADGTGGC